MNGIAAAFGATVLYYVGFAVFKLAADRMATLRGNRILHMIWTILGNWVFLVALALVLGGLTLQILALTEVSLGIAVPIFMSGVVPLLVIAMVFFGDRLTAREWLSLALIGVAILMLVASTGNPPPIEAVDVPSWKLAVVVGPAIVVPLLLIVLGDHRPDGRHARPVTGIAYGLASGFPVGTAELAIKGWSDSSSDGLGILATPYPYVTVLAAALGFGIMVAAFQRCRVTIVAAVMTVSAKSYLLLMGTFMYDEAWPSDGPHALLRVGALVLGAVAVAQFPRHRPVPDNDLPEPEEVVPPAQDPFGGPALGRPTSGVSSLGLAAAPTPYDVPPLDQVPPVQGRPPAGASGPGQVPPPRSPYAHDPLGKGPYWREGHRPPEGRRPPEGPDAADQGRRPPGSPA
ncbi:DMT family transporter [Actinomadura hibisca]|uniref:DMT family transporter n=1 Tax=Actinomadura hibisca TaxID=68565 RepID=UPI000ADBD67C|nr:hypothetical protein [Actinomadura hibisca]